MEVQQTKRLSVEKIKELQEEFLEKKIVFKTLNNERWVGNCQYLDYNPNFPSWGLQITIDRMPVQHVDYKTIKLHQ